MKNLKAFVRKNATWLSYLAAALIMAVPLFAHLDELPLLTWDELRNAQNALEMNQNGQRIVTYISHRPDVWNLKPPLLTWILAFTQRVFGYNELSVRLPSAIAAALTGFYLLGLVKRHTARWTPALLSLVILITSGGYVMNHGTRTGDYDSLLTLFSFLAAGSMLDFLRFGRQRNLLFCMLALTAAVMTKGVAGLFIAPGLLAVSIWDRALVRILRTPSFWTGLGIFLLIVVGYYGWREHLQPGYLQLVWENELGGRFGNSIETHDGEFRYYWDLMTSLGFCYWYLLVLPGVLAAVFSRERDGQRAGLMALACSLSIMLIISSASTKLGWYMMPAYPFIAMLCGMFLDQACRILAEWPWAKTIWRWNFLPLLLLTTLIVPAYVDIAGRSLDAKDPYTREGLHDAGVYLKEALAGNRELQANVICGDDYPLYWYREVLVMKGRQLRVVDSTVLQPGMRVMVWEDSVKRIVKTRYAWAPVEQFRSVEVLRIGSPWRDSPLQVLR